MADRYANRNIQCSQQARTPTQKSSRGYLSFCAMKHPELLFLILKDTSALQVTSAPSILSGWLLIHTPGLEPELSVSGKR